MKEIRSELGHGDFVTDNQANSRWKTVIQWFGYKPTFHDAEVIGIELRRAPDRSTVRVHAWRTLQEVDEEGHFRQDRHAIVTIILKASFARSCAIGTNRMFCRGCTLRMGRTVLLLRWKQAMALWVKSQRARYSWKSSRLRQRRGEESSYTGRSSTSLAEKPIAA